MFCNILSYICYKKKLDHTLEHIETKRIILYILIQYNFWYYRILSINKYQCSRFGRLSNKYISKIFIWEKGRKNIFYITSWNCSKNYLYTKKPKRILMNIQWSLVIHGRYILMAASWTEKIIFWHLYIKKQDS